MTFKSIFRVFLKVLIVLVSIILVTSVINASTTFYEKKNVKPIGKLITINNRKLHLYTQGKSGKNIIMLPGLGTPSPVYDFSHLAKKLSENYRVTIVEPFGYGWSDTTTSTRSNENIIGEIRQALISSDIEPPYILLPHSISGLYTLYYANKYPNEIDGIVCLDTSLPEQLSLYKKGNSFSFNYQLLRDTGIIRLGLLIYPKLYPIDSHSFSRDEKNNILMFCNWNVSNISIVNETSMVKTNLSTLQGTKYPDTFPILMFLSSDTIKNIQKIKLDFDWKAIHLNQLNHNKASKVMVLNGSHYIHHDNYEEIAKQILLTY